MTSRVTNAKNSYSVTRFFVFFYRTTLKTTHSFTINEVSPGPPVRLLVWVTRSLTVGDTAYYKLNA